MPNFGTAIWRTILNIKLMPPKVCAWITVITFSKIYWILPMHSNVTIANVSWPHFSWPTLYKIFTNNESHYHTWTYYLTGRFWLTYIVNKIRSMLKRFMYICRSNTCGPKLVGSCPISCQRIRSTSVPPRPEFCERMLMGSCPISCERMRSIANMKDITFILPLTWYKCYKTRQMHTQKTVHRHVIVLLI